MSELELSAHEKEEQWRMDFRAYFSGLRKHWFWSVSFIGSGAAALVQNIFPDGWKMIPIWAYVGFAMLGLVIASFLAFRDQRRIAESKHIELQSAESKHAQKVQSISSAHFTEIEALKKQLSDDTKKKDEFNDRIINRELMGTFLQQLHTRIDEIMKMSVFDYYDTLKDEKDETSMELVNTIHAFIQHNLGQAEAAIFASKIGMKFSPEELGSDSYTQKANRRKRLVDHFEHWAGQLQKIIESYKP